MNPALDLTTRPRLRLGEQLHILFETNRHLARYTDVGELLRYATERTRALFAADGCAVLLVEPRRSEFYFAAASESAACPTSWAGLAAIRFPATRGIAGWVCSHDQAVQVDDVRHDTRFYDGVDQQTEVTTRSLLCAPLRTGAGNLGVIEVVNPAPDMGPEDLDFLEALAGNVATACEAARTRGEAAALAPDVRTVARLVGPSLLVAGWGCGLAASVAHLAWALPLRELPARPGMLTAAGLCLAGGLVAAATRRRRPG